MLDFIRLLRQRYQTVHLHLSPHSPIADSYMQRIEQLILTEAVMNKNQFLSSLAIPPLQIAIIGPTQVGKSSICNLLFNQELAEVSPLAGYTVQPQGFCHQLDPHIHSALKELLRHSVIDSNYLSAEYTVVLQHTSPTANLPINTVVWDTPDFDSITAGEYKSVLLQTIGFADVIVLVLSPEKYADQTVWELMSMLEPLQQPTLICLNKVQPQHNQLLFNSLTEKWRHARKDSIASIVTIDYQARIQRPLWSKSHTHWWFELAEKVDHSQFALRQHALIQHHWQDWLEPVYAEHRALAFWQQRLQESVDQAIEAYQRDYLNHPHHYHTFQQAVLELLYLLEIPGLAKVLTPLRRGFTWPLRQFYRWRKSPQQGHYPTQELALLNQMAEHLLTQTAEQLLSIAETDVNLQAWWRELYQQLRQQHHQLLAEFNQAAFTYHLNFQQNIEATARHLYQKLQQQPALLNSLRATRLTADAAIVALTVQAGGVGLQDVLITPALLAVVSLLTESAIGGYMATIENRLKQQQLTLVKNELLIQNLTEKLIQLSQQMTDYHQFAISKQQLASIHSFLQPRHGLRLF
jgi:GTPase SAR1 family protein